MRPLELRIQNFRSYRGDPARFDFRGRSLVGIVGPIGSGKSTILDAIAFALYGRTPRVARGTKSLIHQKESQAKVELRFEVDGQVWEASRALRAKGQSQHLLQRLDADDDAAEVVEKLVMEKEIAAKTESLVGLDFAAFGRSVMLAQGQFAEFLQARPAERDKVLKGVFGYDRLDAMRDLAKARRDEAANEAAVIEAKLGNVAEAAQRRDELAAQLADLVAAQERLEAARPELTELDEAIAAAKARALEAGKELQHIAGLADELPTSEESQSLLGEAERMGARRAELAAKVDESQAALDAAEARLEALRQEGTEEVIDEATGLVGKLDALRGAIAEKARRRELAAEKAISAEQELDEAARRLARATAVLDAATAEHAAAAEAFAAAEAKLHEARHADMAATLRAELEPGEPCPVCAQPVAEVPPVDGADVAAAEDALAVAKATLNAAVERLTAAEAEVKAAKEAITRAQETVTAARREEQQAVGELAAAEGTAAGVVGRLGELLGRGDPVELLESVKRQWREARQHVEKARREHAERSEALRKAIDAIERLKGQVSELRRRLDAVAARIGVTLTHAEAEPAALRAAIEELREAWKARRDGLEAQRRQAVDAQHDVEKRRAERLAELGIEGSTLGEALAGVKARREEVEKSLNAVEAAIAEAAPLREALAAAVARRQTYDTLAGHLQDSKFVRWLLEEERARLGALGSEHFERLSSQRYRFTSDGTFQVVDLTAADRMRGADSLSGGETFLASLALALALAEMVSREGGRLDAFFLDEGFGALDPEHLDLAMEGIEHLVASRPDRLVVIVSHVPELRQRLEDLIVLDKDPATGDTIVRSA